MSQRLSGKRARVRTSLSNKRNSCTMCHACMNNESIHQQRWSYWHPHICRACCACASHTELCVCVKRSFVPLEQSLKYSYASTTSCWIRGHRSHLIQCSGLSILAWKEDRPSVAIYCLWVHWSGREMLVDSPSRGFSEFSAPSRIILQLLTGERHAGNNYYCNKYTWNEGEHPSFNYGGTILHIWLTQMITALSLKMYQCLNYVDQIRFVFQKHQQALDKAIQLKVINELHVEGIIISVAVSFLNPLLQL